MQRPAVLRSLEHGYIQTLDHEHLLKAADRHDLLIRLHCHPGDFIACGRPLLDVWPAAALDDETAHALRDTFALGDARTPHGDQRFLINELVEISARALSSGINDPMTAVSCMDWLGAALGELANRPTPGPVARGANGKVRVIAAADEFGDYVAHSLGRLRQYVARDMIASVHMLHVMGLIASDCRTRAQCDVLDHHRQALVELCRSELSGESLRRVEEANDCLVNLLCKAPFSADEIPVPELANRGACS